MHFHHTTETGTRLCADVVRHPDDEHKFIVVFQTQDPRVRDQLVFVFRAVCGHPALAEEYSTTVGSSMTEITRKPLEAVIPKRILAKELDGVRMAAAEKIVEVLEYIKPEMVIEPTETFNKAMASLKYLKKTPAFFEMLPPAMRQFAMAQVDEMMKDLRESVNSKQAHDLAEQILSMLPNVAAEAVAKAIDGDEPSTAN